MAYRIRTKDGELKAEIANSLAQKIVDSASGYFRVANYKTGKKNVFELSSDYKYISPSVVLWLWSGDVLEPVLD